MTIGARLEPQPMSNSVRIRRDGKLGAAAFHTFLASTLLAAVGRNGYYIASAWILVETGHGSASVAVLLAIVSAVEFVSSPLVGMAADRFDRQRMNIAAELCRCVLLLGTAGAMLYLDAFLTICLSAAMFAFCDRIALTAAQSMIPAMAGSWNLAASNSTVFFAMQVGSFGAALLAGQLLNERSPALAFTVLAAFFLVSAGCLYPMQLASLRQNTDKAIGAGSGDLRLVRLFAVYALLYGGAVLISVLGSSFIFEEQKGSSVDFGFLEASWSAGSLIGAALLIRLTRSADPHSLHLMVLGTTAFALMALMFLRSPWTLIVIASLGFFYNLGRVSIEVTLQSLVPDTLLGRAKGCMHSLAAALGLLIFSATALLDDSVLPSTVFFSFGAVLLISVPALSISITRQIGEIMR